MSSTRLLLFAALIIITCINPCHGADRPNVLLIMIDDLNDWVGPLGYRQVKTPNIDRLAARGLTFTNAYTAAPTCHASRFAIMSGQRPSTTGIYTNGPDWRPVEDFKKFRMMPALFRNNGYRSAGAGKIFHAHSYSDQGMFGYNDPASWDEFYPSIERQLPDDLMPVKRPQNGNPGDRAFLGFDWHGLETEDYAMSDGQTTTWAVQELAGEHDTPLFTAIGIYKPHLPWYVPKKYMDMYPLKDIQIPEVPADDLNDVPEVAHAGEMQSRKVHGWVVAEDKWQEAVRAYLASISFADAMVGRVLDALDKSGRADNTIIVLMSDHGWHLGHKLRWRKMELWRQTNHVPLIVVAPGLTEPGSRTKATASLLDIYPTLIELTGLPAPPQKLEGTSLVPLLRDPDANWDHVAISTWRYMNHAVQNDRYRYIRYKAGEEELYDHKNDPNEWHNLAGDKNYRKIIDQLAGSLPKVNTPDRTPPREE